MSLIGNYSVLNKSNAKFTNGTATTPGGYGAVTPSNWKNPSTLRSRDISIPAKSSFPSGYGLGESIIMARSSGGLGSSTQILGTGSLSGSILTVRRMTSPLTGSGTINNAGLGVIIKLNSTINGLGTINNAALLAVSNLTANITGNGTISNAASKLVSGLISTLTGNGSITSASLKGRGSLSADIVIGASTGLSANDVANAVWDQPIASNNSSGTFGWFVQKLLTVAKFLGLK